MKHRAETPSSGPILSDRFTRGISGEIPIIDFKEATSTDPVVRRALADLMRNACINIGFFYVINHGMSEEHIKDVVKAGKRFFSLSDTKKMELDIRKTHNFKGYTALLQESTDSKGHGDLHEGFDIGWEPELSSDDITNGTNSNGAMSGCNVWPSEVPGFKEAVLTYYHTAVRFGKLLFPLFSLALDLPEDFFADKTTKPAAIMRLLHYPTQSPTSIDDRQIGIGAHTDYECFTLLWQDDVGGLEVQNADGKWIEVLPIPGTLVVNLGDQFARWTNDIFKSTVHRAINKSGFERYSIPLFFGTDYDVLLEPIPTCISPGNPAKYDIVTAGEYVKSRLEATYQHTRAA